jgi:hypothetical protein
MQIHGCLQPRKVVALQEVQVVGKASENARRARVRAALNGWPRAAQSTCLGSWSMCCSLEWQSGHLAADYVRMGRVFFFTFKVDYYALSISLPILLSLLPHS